MAELLGDGADLRASAYGDGGRTQEARYREPG
jgi:hypothetical protein